MKLGIRLAGLALILAPMAASAGRDPQVDLATPGVGGGAIERFTLHFTDPIVALGDPRAAAPVMVVAPNNGPAASLDASGTMPVPAACAGTGRWVDPRSFVYEFAKPLPGGARCDFVLREGLRTVSGVAVGGQRRFSVDAGGPYARAVLAGTEGDEIEEDQVFLVATNMAADRASIAANAYCAVDGIGEKIAVDLLGAEVPAQLLGQTGTDPYQVSNFLDAGGLPQTLPADAAQRQKTLASVVALKCRRPLPAGRDMALVWPGAIKSPAGKPAGEDRRFDYRVRKPFTARWECERVNEGAGCSPLDAAHLRLSAPIAMSAARAIRIELPNGKSIAPDFSGDGTHGDAKVEATTADISFKAPLPFATGAKLVLPADLKDESGRALSNAQNFPLAIRFDPAPPLVKFAASFGILESKAGGVLPVTVRGVEPSLLGQTRAIAGQSVRAAGSDGEVAGLLRAVDAAQRRASHDETRGGEQVTVEDTGAAPVLAAGKGAPLKLDLPGKGKDFEVVGIPLGTPGFYVVELASPALGEALLGRKAPRYVASAALVTNMAVHFKWGRERSLAWVTTLDGAKPVAGAAVRVSDYCTGALLAQGTTDKSGGLFVTATLPEPQSYSDCDGTSHALMVSARAGDDYSFTLTDWGEGIRPFDFDLPYGWSARGETFHTVFDRALVRQGETVNMKHVLRQPFGGGFKLAPGFTGTLRLTHSGSDTQFDLPVTINASGTGTTSWTVPQGAPLGDYNLALLRPGQETLFTGQSFRVDEYRLPTMRASVTGPKTPQVQPRSVPLDLFVGYLSGGGAARLPVGLRVGWSAGVPSPQGYDGYGFGGEAIKEGTQPLGADTEEPGADQKLPPIQTLPLTLDGEGAARQTLDIPALGGPTTMTVEMDYQDANGETLTASRAVPLYESAVQLGVKTDGWLMKADDLRLRFVALDLDGKPIKGQRIEVALYSREILTMRRRLIGGFYAYDNQARTTKLAGGCTTTSDAQGLAQCAINAGASGEVYAVATTSDANGHVARAVQSVWLAGDNDWWFGGDNGDRMDVVPEKPAYKSGETAAFQVRMPFRHATALVTVEREGVLSARVVELDGKDPVVRVPMPESYAPNVYVSVLAVRGRIEPGFWDWLSDVGAWLGLAAKREPTPAPSALVDLAKPAYRLGIAKVQVGWEGHQLGVSVKADRERYAPRDVAQVDVAVRRPDGKPAASADVAFVAVDEALLQLAPNESWDVLKAMMGERSLSVLTATAQTQVVGKRHYGKKAVAAGGGGGDASAINRDNFKPVLLWRGSVPLDAEGHARVAVPLSDALTAFRLVAIATDGAQLFGMGDTRVRAAQDLSIFAGLPPVVRSGDWYGGIFTLRNASAKPMTVTATVELSPRVAVGRALTVTVPAGGAVPVMWNLTAPKGEGTLRWQVRAKSADGKAADAITVSQSVIAPVPVSVWAATLTQVGASTSIPIAPPAGALPGLGAVELRLDDSLAPPLAGVRDFMTAYPYSCFEQRLSRIVTLGDTGGWAALAGEIPTYLAPDGLLRFWPSDRLDGSESLTAYVLSMTAEAGLPIPEASRTKMIEGLRAVLDGRVEHENYGDRRLRRLAAFTALARAGAGTPAMLGQLGITPAEMPTAQLADYLVALDRIPGLANGQALRLAGERVLRSRLVYEGTRIDLTDQDSAAWWLLSSADEGALKAALAVLGRPGWQEEGPRLIVGVAQRQRRGHWDTTTANAWGTLAARRFAGLYPAAAVAGTTRVTLGAASQSRAWPLAAEGRLLRLPLPAQQTPLVLAQSGGAGPWATVSVSAAVPLKAPLFAGYRMARKVDVVQRRHPDRLSRGDVLRITLVVEASAERNWVVINDPIPAGATIIGDLGGQSQLLGGQGSDGGGVRGRFVDGQGKVWDVQLGVSAAYVERRQDSWRGYFDWVPRGTFAASYLVRLNGAGTSQLPPTRIEAMYSPSIHADLPNAPVTVAAR